MDVMINISFVKSLVTLKFSNVTASNNMMYLTLCDLDT